MSKSCWPLRSLLFLPAYRIEWVRKIALSAVDAVILDLEDSVPPARKPEARSLIAEEIDILDRRGIAVIVRVNGLDAGCQADIEAVVRPGLAGVMLPKANCADDISQLHTLLDAAEQAAGIAQGDVGIIPLPETAQGLWSVREIAGASTRVTGLITAVSGPVSGDVSRTFGFQPTVEGHEQLFLQSRVILASRAAGANYPIGTIQGTRLDDLDMVERLARRAKQLGFSGVALVHPTHVAIANNVFRPTQEEVDYSLGLIDALRAAEARGDGAVSYLGTMVDAAMLPLAHEIIAADARYRERDERQP
jgi:citrate lyase subunit beta/citryl-CoA lyase